MACAAMLSGCAGELSALDPAGPQAAHIADIWWAMLAGATLILAGVVGTAIYAFRSKRETREFSDRRVLIGWGMVFPTVVLIVLMVFAFLGGERLSAHDEGAGPIRVNARQWSWDAGYPGGQRSAGIIHIPAGRSVTLAITSDDVIHSFWVPRLGGKIDAIPGKENRIRLMADEPGVYRGQCAEYCGIGHAVMPFEVHAHPQGDYAAVLARLPDGTSVDRPDLQPRRQPVSTIIESWADYLRDWLATR